MQETCPIFLMNGEKVVEVAYTTWETTDGGATWNWVEKSLTLTGIDGDVDHIVWEGPIGCMMMPMEVSLKPEDKLVWSGTPYGPGWSQCQRVSYASTDDGDERETGEDRRDIERAGSAVEGEGGGEEERVSPSQWFSNYFTQNPPI